MSVFKCKMCGGTLEVRENESVCVCDFCGTQQTIATTQDEALQGLFNRANILRMKSEFDKAESLYEKIIQTKPDEAEAYWGLILCRYGIEYVEDPKTFKRIPTCHRTSFDSVIADPDYKAALQYADLAQRAIYEAEAKEIDRLQKEILALSQKEEPYDVFICYKETDETGRRTPDSVIANDIYHQLTQEGFKVFYAAISLENKLGSAYEPCIFAALNSAKVMLVVGTKPEYFNAVWVKNEWSRYLKLMKTDRSRILIPCYRDMDAYELPEEFAHLQAQDMSKIGFINDVVRGIKKVLRKDAPTVQPAAAPASANAAAAQPLIDRGYMALEDKEWAKADEFFEQALNLDAKNGDAYLGKFLVSVKHASLQSFLKERSDASYIDYHTEHSCKEAFRPNEEALRKTVAQYAVPGYLEEARMLRELMEFDVYYDSQAGLLERYISDCRNGWASNKDLIRAKQYGRPEIGAQLNAFFEKLKEEYARAKQSDAETVAQKKNEYQQFVRDYKAKAAQMSVEARNQADADAAEQARLSEEQRAAKERDLNEKYQKAVALANKANSVDTYNQAIKAFVEIRTYRDSDQQVQTLTERRDRIKAQTEKERAKKKKRNVIIGACALVIVVALCVVAVIVKNVVIPNNHYNRAIELMNQGQYSEAITAFETIKGYKDSNTMIGKCETAIEDTKYNAAVDLYNAGEYDKAISAFTALNGYKDSAEQITKCKTAIKESKYIFAISLIDKGDIINGYESLTALNGYKDSAERAKEVFGKYKREKIKTASVGDTVYFGSFEQDNNLSNGKEDVEWLVLSKEDNRILVVSKYALDCQQYNLSFTNVTWETCSLRQWLNETFLKAAFSSKEQKSIQSTIVKADNNPTYNISPGNDTTDKVFLLSIVEANKYFSTDSARRCMGTAYCYAQGAHKSSEGICKWWLRSPGMKSSFASFVSNLGSAGDFGFDVNFEYNAVRPAMWIDFGA